MSAASIGRERAGRTIARPAPSPRSVRTRPPRATVKPRRLDLPRRRQSPSRRSSPHAWYVASPRNPSRRRKHVCSAAGPTAQIPRETPTQRGTHARPPRHFPRRIHPNVSPRVASRRATHLPRPTARAPANPPSNFTCRCCAVRLSSRLLRLRLDRPRRSSRGCRRFPCVRRPAFAEPDFFSFFSRRVGSARAAGSDSSSPRRSPSLSFRSLSSGRRDNSTKDEPFAFESREALRRTLIGRRNDSGRSRLSRPRVRSSVPRRREHRARARRRGLGQGQTHPRRLGG